MEEVGTSASRIPLQRLVQVMMIDGLKHACQRYQVIYLGRILVSDSIFALASHVLQHNLKSFLTPWQGATAKLDVPKQMLKMSFNIKYIEK